jgi:phosphohistidine phosphatase SixA
VEMYLIHHAAASESDPDCWLDNCDRPLTPEDEKTSRLTARGLRLVVSWSDSILSSAHPRAWWAAEILFIFENASLLRWSHAPKPLITRIRPLIMAVNRLDKLRKLTCTPPVRQ